MRITAYFMLFGKLGLVTGKGFQFDLSPECVDITNQLADEVSAEDASEIVPSSTTFALEDPTKPPKTLKILKKCIQFPFIINLPDKIYKALQGLERFTFEFDTDCEISCENLDRNNNNYKKVERYLESMSESKTGFNDLKIPVQETDLSQLDNRAALTFQSVDPLGEFFWYFYQFFGYVAQFRRKTTKNSSFRPSPRTQALLRFRNVENSSRYEKMSLLFQLLHF